MKFAIFFKGPIRSSHDYIINNIKIIKDFLMGHEIDDYIFTWNSESARNLASKNPVKNFMMLQEPDTSFVKSNLLLGQTKIGSLSQNAYKHFWSMRNITRLIYETHNLYDYVWYFRTDIEYKINNIEAWTQNDKYAAPFSYHNNQIVTNDIMGCAKPEVMMNAWDYKNIENLNRVYNMAEYPEQCFDQFAKDNGIEIIRHAHFWPPVHQNRVPGVKYELDIMIDENRGQKVLR